MDLQKKNQVARTPSDESKWLVVKYPQVLTNLRSEVRNFIRAWQDPDKLPNEFPRKTDLRVYFLEIQGDEGLVNRFIPWEEAKEITRLENERLITEDSWKEMKDFFWKKCGGIQPDYLEWVLKKLEAEKKIIIEDRDFFYRHPYDDGARRK